MKQFLTILKFELSEYFRNRIFIGITAFMVLLLAAVMFLPKLAGNLFSSGGPQKKSTMIVAADWNALGTEESTELQQSFEKTFPAYEISVMDSSESEDIRTLIRNGDSEAAFVFEDGSVSRYTYYVQNLGLYDTNTAAADEMLNRMIRTAAFEEKGISSSDASMIMSLSVSHDTESLGQDQTASFFYTYIMVMALYMVIAMYGQMVASHVAAEKDSRVMELLISASSPTAMMFGKVLASCLAGLFQLTVIFGCALLFYRMNPGAWGGSMLLASIFDIPPHLLAYMLIFFLLGYLIYAFLYGAVGSTVSRIEDLSTAVTPLTMIFVAVFIIVITAMSSGNVDSGIMVFASYFPLSSPIAMFTRIAMGSVPFWQVMISIVILVLTLLLTGRLSAKIYRAGVLMYGTKKNLFRLIAEIMRA